jgi:hypothetical protein
MKVEAEGIAGQDIDAGMDLRHPGRRGPGRSGSGDSQHHPVARRHRVTEHPGIGRAGRNGNRSGKRTSPSTTA